VTVPDDLPRHLEALWSLLVEANAHTNLTRIESPDEFREKHALDALLALPVIEAGLGPELRGVDVGTGGGVPGFPLALARPTWALTLLEARGKKAEFLEAARASLGLERVEVVCARAEAYGRGDGRESHDVAVARALGGVPTCLELTLPLVRVGGRVVLYRGPREGDLGDLERKVAARLGGGQVSTHDLTLPSGVGRRLVVVEKTDPCPEGYPRRDGVPAKRPLA
jgi:16S rRNA (guanine527-N7)-methyltransferase